MEGKDGEKGDPYCASISVSSWDHSEPIASFWFGDVVRNRLHDVKKRFFEVMEAVAKVTPLPEREGEEKKKDPIWGIDMKRMGLVIKRVIRSALSGLEEGPHDSFSGSAILDFLYGGLLKKEKKGRLECMLDDIALMKKMLEKGEDYWVRLVKQYILPPAPTMFLVAEPSKEEGERLVNEEKKRVKEQQQKIGKEGLKDLKKKLKGEIAKNEVPIPDGILEEIPIPSPSSISLFPVTTVTKNFLKVKPRNAIVAELEKKEPEPAPEWAVSLQKEMKDLPLFLQFDHIKSNFIEIRMVYDTSSLSPEHRKLLELYLDVLCELSIKRVIKGENGEEVEKVIPYEEVVLYLEELTVSIENSVGLGGQTEFVPGSYGQLLELVIKGLIFFFSFLK